MLPHAQAVAKVLIERLDMQIVDGDDLSMCTALEVLSMLTESLEAMESEGTEMAELSGWPVEFKGDVAPRHLGFWECRPIELKSRGACTLKEIILHTGHHKWWKWEMERNCS